MADAMFDATSQQTPQERQLFPQVMTKRWGPTTPVHISSTMAASASTVAAATQSNTTFGSQLNQSLWAFDPINHRNQPYGMPSSFMVGHHTNPYTFSE